LIEAIAILGGLPELPTCSSLEPLMPEDGIDVDQDDEVNLDPTTIKRFAYKPAKGSHSKWIHPKLSQAIIIAGKDSNDAKLYLEKQVTEALAELKKIEADEQEKPKE